MKAVKVFQAIASGKSETRGKNDTVSNKHVSRKQYVQQMRSCGMDDLAVCFGGSEGTMKSGLG